MRLSSLLRANGEAGLGKALEGGLSLWIWPAGVGGTVPPPGRAGGNEGELDVLAFREAHSGKTRCQKGPAQSGWFSRNSHFSLSGMRLALVAEEDAHYQVAKLEVIAIVEAAQFPREQLGTIHKCAVGAIQIPDAQRLAADDQFGVAA